MRWAGHVACIGAERGTQGFGGEALEKTACGLKNFRGREDGIKMAIQEKG